ncbi:MAG TPA: amidohydrolase family protein [Bacteroidales bacterium]|nr:amidohydrolase family protein [Bacteroidales bacterium]
MDLLLKNTTYVDWQDLSFHQTNLLVKGDNISPALTIIDELKDTPANVETIDCQGMLVMRSFAIGHHHVYSALSRGMNPPPKAPQNFHENLQYVWWRLDKALDRDLIRASALATAMACAKSGVTFVIDHHASPNAIAGSLSVIAEAFDEVGVGHLLCYEITDRDGLDKAAAGLQETTDYLAKHQGLVGLHASFTVGDDTMRRAAELMRQSHSGVHIHVAEDPIDQKLCEERHQKRVVQRLADFGLLESSKTILGHCLHLDDSEKQLVRESPAWVVENIESNLNNNVGFFDGEKLGSNIFLGTDGMHSEILRSAQTAFFAGKHNDHLTMAGAWQRLRNVHRYLNENNFYGDGDNNLVVLDYDAASPITPENFLAHFLFGFRERHVRHVIANGKLIVRDRQLQTVDEQEVLKFTRQQSLRLWERMGKY